MSQRAASSGKKEDSFDTLRLRLNSLKTSREIPVQIGRLRYQQLDSVQMNWAVKILETYFP